jgi:hypothetical protein
MGFGASIVATLALLQADEPFRKVLISVERNFDLESAEILGREVAPGSPAEWSVKKVALRGGKQEGVSLIVVDNGRIRITIIPTRGMGILSVTRGDSRLGWDSPIRQVVHPSFVNLQARGGLGWLDGFNEWMVRCGLESCGHPGTDRFVNNVGEEATMELTLHGKIANIPAHEVDVVADRKAPYRIRVRGRVDERMFHGPKLELETEISTEPGAASFRVADAVHNRGAVEQEFQVLYHCNFGRPLLEEGAVFSGALDRVTPFNARAAEGLKSFARIEGPAAGFVEQVYCIRPRADAGGRTVAMLRNRAGDRAASMAYPVGDLPCFTLWKYTAAEADGYVTGLEPGTGFPSNRRIERKHGRVPKLGPGQTRRFTIDFGLHEGADEIRAMSERIAAIQGDRPPVIDPEPEKKE